jgi:hypothetical protein
MIKIVNGYKDGFIGENKLYIGRYNHKLKLKTSPLSNPYFISKVLKRDEAIALYKRFIWQSIKRCRDELIVDGIMDELIKISKSNNTELVCYCKPLPCHGDIIINAVEWLKTQEWFNNHLF